MNIYVNGKKEEIAGAMSLLKLLDDKSIRPEVVTVELNEQIIAKDTYDRTLLKQDDKLEFVHYMGGGAAVIAQNVLELIGNTPLVRLNTLVKPEWAEVLGKLESFNPGGSVKDRICLSMIVDAEKKGLLKPGSTIVEPTSGNTGIGLAMVAAVKKYRCILTMPETMSLERIYILKSYGAEVILTPGKEGMLGSIKKAEEILKKTPNGFMPQQFLNPANPEAHRRATAKEILEATGGSIDAFVSGIGTGGTITGVGEILKKQVPGIMIVAVEPASSAVLSGRESGPHKIQGIGAGFVPKVLNRDVIDRIELVDDNDAFRTSRKLCVEEGLFVGISAGAAVVAALRIAKELGKGKRIVTVLPDTGERYFSMERYFES
ncbi:MAG: cysteine synthase A [Candidatus Omnitrophota bacterium]